MARCETRNGQCSRAIRSPSPLVAGMERSRKGPRGDGDIRDGTTPAFERAGEGPPLILVAGALDHRATLAPLAALLVPDHTTITSDRRRRGDSRGIAPAIRDSSGRRRPPRRCGLDRPPGSRSAPDSTVRPLTMPNTSISPGAAAHAARAIRPRGCSGPGQPESAMW